LEALQSGPGAMRLVSPRRRGTFQRWQGSTPALALVVIGVVIFSPTAGAFGVLASVPVRGDPSGRLAAASTSISAAADPKVLAHCSVPTPDSDVPDPADGLVYVANGGSASISIVKPPCDVVATIAPTGAEFPIGTAYDPVTQEVVVTDYEGVAYVFRGTALVKTVWLGGSSHCPKFESWDAYLRAMLIADQCSPDGHGGVDELFLSIVGGVTRATVVLDTFDQGNVPGAVLVADGYVFSVGNNVNAYDDRTLAFLGEFAAVASPYNTLAWDPLNDTVVLGRGNVFPGSHSVVFLNANSVRTHTFTFHYWITHDIFEGGVGGVAYSPYTKQLYFTAHNDVWEIGNTGVLVHVYLAQGASPYELTYDPVNHDMYVCGYYTGEIYVIA